MEINLKLHTIIPSIGSVTLIETDRFRPSGTKGTDLHVAFFINFVNALHSNFIIFLCNQDRVGSFITILIFV